MDMIELIKTRKSVRTFDGRNLSDDDKKKIAVYIQEIPNPYDIPVKFVLLDAKKHGLSSPVIQGEQLYIVGKVPKVSHCEEAFGFSFEKMVLYAWSLGIGTTWIGGTMKRQNFEKASETGNDEFMPCISPLGYPAKKRSVREIGMRTAIKADKRLPDMKLFFDKDFSSPLNDVTGTPLEVVRLAPSAVNKQPWRIVRDGNKYHFYEKRTINGGAWDIQKIDMGIAICHLMSVMNGVLHISDPNIPTEPDINYIATVLV